MDDKTRTQVGEIMAQANVKLQLLNRLVVATQSDPAAVEGILQEMNEAVKDEARLVRATLRHVSNDTSEETE